MTKYKLKFQYTVKLSNNFEIILSQALGYCIIILVRSATICMQKFMTPGRSVGRVLDMLSRGREFDSCPGRLLFCGTSLTYHYCVGCIFVIFASTNYSKLAFILNQRYCVVQLMLDISCFLFLIQRLYDT